jgi:hypothetical protein
MWNIVGVTGSSTGYYAHVDFPEWEVHPSTQNDVPFELRNTSTGHVFPLLKNQPNANIYTALVIASETVKYAMLII